MTRLQLLAMAVAHERRAVMTAVATFALDEARRRSSGPFSSAELAAADHPYARRHGGAFSGAYPPGTINVQRGAFLSGWEMDIGPDSARVSNQTEVADFLKDGTRFMVPRPVGDEVEAAAGEEIGRQEALAEARLEAVR